MNDSRTHHFLIDGAVGPEWIISDPGSVVEHESFIECTMGGDFRLVMLRSQIQHTVIL